VGIGTSSPNTRLQVYKAAASAFTGTSPGAFIVTDSTNTLNYFTSIDFNTTNAPSVPYARIGMYYTSSGSNLNFGTTNSYASGITNTAMTIDPTGNVGIGTTTPSVKLSVISAANTPSLILTDGTQSTLTIKHEATNLLTYETTGSATQRFVLNSAEAMRINSSGNVGIGTTSLTTKLRVVSAVNDGISVTDGTVNTIIYNSTGGTSSIGTTSNHPMDIYTNNTVRARFDASGNF